MHSHQGQPTSVLLAEIWVTYLDLPVDFKETDGMSISLLITYPMIIIGVGTQKYKTNYDQ